MSLELRRFGSIVLLLAALSACGQSEENLAVLANAPGTFAVGDPQRILVALVDPATGEHLSSPEVAATATLTSPGGDEAELSAAFLWTVPDVSGLYRINYTFDQVGSWWVRLNPAGYGATPGTPFSVGTSDPVPGRGDPAPLTATPTLADHTIEQISSDDEPNPAFYALSLDEALSNGKPTVVVFATPAFCVSRTCGPMLDQVKTAAPTHSNANYVHVEIYENLDAPSVNQLRIAPAVVAWSLPSEPWVFVVDANGTIAARFEGAMDAEEFAAALAEVGA